MITRSVNVLFKNGMCVKLALPPHAGSELDSTKKFIDKIKVYKDAIQRFMVRNPNLELGKKEKKVDNLTDFFHVLLNARKYVDLQRRSVPAEQEFSLDFASGCFSVYDLYSTDVLGTMYFNAMYDNWEQLFYPSSPSIADTDKISVSTYGTDGVISTAGIASTFGSIGVELIESLEKYLEERKSSESVAKEEPKLVEFNPVNDLTIPQYALYKLLFIDRGYKGKVEIRYSGVGDSGNTDSIILHETTIKRVDLVDDADIDRLIWNVIYEQESGFYNDDGGHGIINISPTGFKWEHYNYFTDSNQTVNIDCGKLSVPDYIEEKEEEDDEDEDIFGDDTLEEIEEDLEEDDEEEDHPDHYAKYEDSTDYKDAEYDKYADDPSPELPF